MVAITYRTGDIPPTPQDFHWKPTDRPQSTLVPNRAGSLRAQFANNTLTIPVLPLVLTSGDYYRAGDNKVAFRVIKAHCSIGLGSHSAFSLACNMKHLIPVDSRPPLAPTCD